MGKHLSQGDSKSETSEKNDAKEQFNEHVRIKVLGITLIEANKVTAKLIILVAVVLILCCVLALIIQRPL